MSESSNKISKQKIIISKFILQRFWINLATSWLIFVVFTFSLLAKNQTGFEIWGIIFALFCVILVPFLSWYFYFFVSKYTSFSFQINSFKKFLEIVPILIFLWFCQIISAFVHPIILIILGIIFWKCDWKINYLCVFLYPIFLFLFFLTKRFFYFDFDLAVNLIFPTVLTINYCLFPIEIWKFSKKNDKSSK